MTTDPTRIEALVEAHRTATASHESEETHPALRLDALDAAERDATAGPWHADAFGRVYVGTLGVNEKIAECFLVDRGVDVENATLIALMRTNARAMLGIARLAIAYVCEMSPSGREPEDLERLHALMDAVERHTKGASDGG